MLNDRIEDVLLENKYLRKRVEVLEKQLAKGSMHMRPNIAQFKTKTVRSAQVQQWDEEVIASPMINNVQMVKLSKDRKNFTIGVAGLYNVVIRFGSQYYSNSFSGAQYYRLRLNGKDIAILSYDAYQGGSVCFNEYLQLKQGDSLSFCTGGVYISVVNYNHFTIIRLSD